MHNKVNTMNTQTAIDLSADIIDVRDIIVRYEELESESDGLPNAEERYQLTLILAELKGEGGDEQWRGDWYPVTLICDSHFTNYAREMLEDCGLVPREFPNYIEIDWDATARNVRTDYTCTDIDGVTYWYR
jgi:hypothetical protein